MIPDYSYPYVKRTIIIQDSTEIVMDVSSFTIEQSIDTVPYVRIEGGLINMSSMSPVSRYITSLKAKKVIYHNPATVVLWEDGTKTVVKCDSKDEYNEMLGLALCYMKKALGNSSRNLNDALRSGAYSAEL